MDNMSEDDFDTVTTNFNLPLIGKLYTDYQKIKNYNNKVKFLESYVKNKRDRASV